MPDPNAPQPNWWRGATGISATPADNAGARARSLLEGVPVDAERREPTIRASTWGEWLGDKAHDVTAAIANSLPVTITDKLPLVGTDLRGQVRAAEEPQRTLLGMLPPPELSRGGRAASGIKAYHGSGADFNRFDSRYIGTGEGNQAYSYGHYFAGNENVAEGYRKSLSTPTVEIGAQPQSFPSWSGSLSPEQRVVRRLGDRRSRFPAAPEAEIIDRVRADLQEELADRSALTGGDYKAQVRQELAHLQDAEAKGLRTTPGGKMYEVNLDVDPEHLLDWDRGLHQQSPYVTQRLRDVVTTTPQATGAMAYNRAAGAYGSPAAASDALRISEIPGVRYLNQGSRVFGDAERILANYGSREKALEAAEQRLQFASLGDVRYWSDIVKQLKNPETHNYVMFDDSLISILRKYGLLPPLAASALGGSRALDALRQPQSNQEQVATPPPAPAPRR